MAGEKSQTPFENLGTSPDSHHTTLSDRVVASDTSDSADPPPYTITATTTPSAPTAQETHPPNTSGPQSQSLEHKPIAIPAIGSSSDSPFLRAYAPILTTYNLPRDSFFSFLDHLNKVISGSPPLQVLDATGGILQSVPILFPLRWIGSAVSGLASLGSQGVSKSRADSYLRQANRETFGPRGLKVEIAKLDALAYMANIPILDSNGKVSRQNPLLQRLLETGGAAEGARDAGMVVEQRQVEILQPWIAALELDILPWTSKSKLTRFNAALKKRNDPAQWRDGLGQSSEASEETDIRHGLWLVIRPMDA